MTNPTTPFSWQMPTSTDLVTDLPADFETFGQAVATSMADLLGGTTGQVLSKASNTDMDFTWVTSDDANAIQNAIVDAKGDLISATAADTPARLASSGVNGNVLTVDTTTATGLKWAAPAGGGKVLQVVSTTYSTSTTIATTTYTDTGLSLAITPTASTSKILVIANVYANVYRQSSADGAAGAVRLLRDASVVYAASGTGNFNSIEVSSTTANAYQVSSVIPVTYLDSPATTSSTTYKVQARPYSSSLGGVFIAQNYSSISTITLLEIGA